MTVRVGVIGTGFGARVVAPVFAATPGCEVADVVSARDDAGIASMCERSDVDLISVHSPPFLHGMHVRRAIAGGNAVLCDKPFGIDASEAETLLAAAEAADVLHLVNFEFRYDPMRERLKALLTDGAIGVPEHVTWTHHSARSRVPLRQHGWLFERDKGGGWLGAWGSHAIDTLRWLIGEVADARGVCRTAIRQRPDADDEMQPCDAEDGFSAWLAFETGPTAAIDSTFAAAASVAPRLVVTGSVGVIECVADAKITLRRADGTREEYARPPSDIDPHLEPMQRWALAVCMAVESGTPPPRAATFADGLACAQVLDQLRGGDEACGVDQRS